MSRGNGRENRSEKHSPVERRRDVAADEFVRLGAFGDARDERVREGAV